MPTIHAFDHGALKVCIHADDHAPPHFHLIRNDDACLVSLADFAVMAGEIDRRDYASAVAGPGPTAGCSKRSGRLSMSATDRISVGGKLPRIRAVLFRGGYDVEVRWAAETRDGGPDVVDLAPLILTLKVFAPLRTDRELMDSVHVASSGASIAWGDDDAIDMSALSVLRLAEDATTAADVGALMRRNDLTLGRVAAELGINRRLAARYASGRPVPRSIARACELIDRKGSAGEDAEPSSARERHHA